MGCDEILVHGGDITGALDLPYEPPSELCAQVLVRLFPWAPTDEDPWQALLWAIGRQPLGDRARLAADWWWECAPLREWDGTVRARSELDPPGWR